jgi:hypothetical protein
VSWWSGSSSPTRFYAAPYVSKREAQRSGLRESRLEGEPGGVTPAASFRVETPNRGKCGMSRFAILIASPDGGADALPGPPHDIARLRAFLTSPIGGAWHDVPEEIRAVTHPTVDQLTALIEEANQRDYAVVVFSGHGSHVGGNTRLSLSVSHQILAEDLAAQITTRATLVIDACRVPPQPPHLVMEIAEWEELLAEGAHEIADYRALFEQEFHKVPVSSVTTLYACRVGETAADTPDGAVFLSCLVNEAVLWANGQHFTKPRRFSVAEAWLLASKRMQLIGVAQNPVMAPLHDYRPKPPFAVWMP